MKKDLRISELCDVYGRLLTERQLEILNSYYDYDLSLAEISENFGVTRQAVHDAIAKASEQLNFYENALGVYAMRERIATLAEAISEANECGDKDRVASLVGELRTL